MNVRVILGVVGVVLGVGGVFGDGKLYFIFFPFFNNIQLNLQGVETVIIKIKH